jgi:hypothetical protein
MGFPGFMDPFAPNLPGATRPRLGGAPLPGTREPYVVGSAGWTRSIPVDFIERDNEYVVSMRQV